MPLISENWPTLLAPGLRKVFHARMRARDEMFKRTQIFPIDTSSRAYEDMQGVGELGTQGWNEFEKTGRTTYDEFVQGWKTRLEHREFAQGVVIRRKLIDDNLYPGAGIPSSITGQVAKLADSAAVHREKSAANVFINAFTDSGTDSEGFDVAGADGVGLCGAHKHSPSDSTTQTNEGTTALSKSGVQTTALAMREFTDDRGELVAIRPDTLLVPPELEKDTALEIVGSQLDPGNANNTINVVRGRYNVVAWDYLSDANAWFMLDSMLRDQHLVWLDRVMPEFQNAFDYDTQQARFPAYQRFSRGFDAWQWVFGQNPS